VQPTPLPHSRTTTTHWEFYQGCTFSDFCKGFISTLCIGALVAILNIGSSTPVKAQCNGQDALNCNCQQTTDYNINVCINGTTGTITIKVCNQFPNPNLIRNPCTQCTEPLNSITNVKEICVPPEFATKTYAELLPGIVCATNLCKSPNFFGVVIPDCVPAGSDACNTTNPYCHVLSLPRCVRREGNCWIGCDTGCENRCWVWRKYCRDSPTSCWTCALTETCELNPSDECPQGCELLEDCPRAHPTCCN
jgi:hypothetical protein